MKMSYERKMRNLLFILVFFFGSILLVGYSQLSINDNKKIQRIDQRIDQTNHEKSIIMEKIIYKFKPVNFEFKLLIY